MSRLNRATQNLARPLPVAHSSRSASEPRRPPLWRAPGPRPAAPEERPECWPREGEDLSYLSGDWRILQRRDGHRWSLDDLVTAWVAADECRDAPPGRIADLGCGIGAVLLLMAWRFERSRLVGIEAQPTSVDLARRSIGWNGVESRCVVHLGDLRSSPALGEEEPFALVTATPPYLPRGTGWESARTQWGPCHFEHRGGVEDYCAAAARVLEPDGVFVFCAGAVQEARVASAVSSAGLVVARRLDVVPRAGKAVLFSVYGARPAASGSGVMVEPPLVVRDAEGRRTPRFVALRHDMGMPP